MGRLAAIHDGRSVTRLKFLLDLPTRNPRATLSVLRDALLATLAVVLCVRFVLWEPLEATVLDAVRRGEESSMLHLASTPFDVLRFQATVALVVGFVVGGARIWTIYWHRRRERAGVVEDWTLLSPTTGFLAGGFVLFLATTLGAASVALATIDGVLETAGFLPEPIHYGSVVHATMIVVVFGLSVGIAPIFAYVLAVFSTEDVASGRRLTRDGFLAFVVATGFGFVAWSGVPYGLAVWTAAIFVGYVVGLVLASVGVRRR